MILQIFLDLDLMVGFNERVPIVFSEHPSLG